MKKESSKPVLVGKKCGMTLRFSEKGVVIPCSVLHIEKNVVLHILNKEKQGYSALQLACGKIDEDEKKAFHKINKPLGGVFKKLNIAPRKRIHEARMEETASYEAGQEIGVELFEDAFVDVSAVSKGKGFQGVIKRWGHSGGPASHGSKFHREKGSTGMCSSPGRTFPGGRMPGQMGNKRVTVQNLKVVAVDPEKGLLVVRGAVPGPSGGWVKVSLAKKKAA